MSNNKKYAIKVFTYYFRLIAEKSGIRWDSANEADITNAVEVIFDEIEDQIQDHNDARISHIH